MIYLDNAASTPIHIDVLKSTLKSLKNTYANPGSLHCLGEQAAREIKEARKQAADLINANEENIVFTSGGTEANNLVFEGIKDYLLEKQKTNIIISAVEHDSVFNASKKLIKDGFYVTHFPVELDSLKISCGKTINLDLLSECLNSSVGLVSIMYANNETGEVYPVEEIGKMCKEKGILFHIDCVQAAGYYDIDVEKLNCDFLTVSGHKIHAPKGTGFLYIRDKSILNPLIVGGTHQEFGLRGGTENTAGIVGFGKACEIAKKNLINNRKHIDELSNVFLASLYLNTPDEFLKVNRKRGKIINLRIKGIDAQTLVLALSTKGVCVSAGSACRSQELEPSRALKFMGLTDEEAYESIRISFSPLNTIEEIEAAAVTLAQTIWELKNM